MIYASTTNIDSQGGRLARRGLRSVHDSLYMLFVILVGLSTLFHQGHDTIRISLWNLRATTTPADGGRFLDTLISLHRREAGRGKASAVLKASM
jgi:hypothetical protein